jgi:hypothetical protein
MEVDMNVGSANAALLWSAAKGVDDAASAGDRNQALTFRGRPIIAYARDGLPVIGQTTEERMQAVDRLLAAASARGEDVSNPKFAVMHYPIRDTRLGPTVAYQERIGLQLPTPKPVSGPLPFTLSPVVLERMQEARETEEPAHGTLDSIAGDGDATADGSDRIYAAFFHNGNLYATVDRDGVVTIDGTAAYLAAALASVEGAEARTVMLENLIPPDKATRYGAPGTAPTFDELWNPKPTKV